MVVGVLQFELLVPWAQSLKDKRRVVRSVKDRLHREHQVSVAEVSDLECLTRASLGLSVVSNDGAHAGQVLDRITEKLRSLPDAQLGQTTRDILHGSQLEHRSPQGVHADPLLTQELCEMARQAEEALR